MITQTIDNIEFKSPVWPPEKHKPVLVLIHGATLSKSFWNSQINALGDVSTPVALDLPGHGGSRGESKKSIAEYAQSVVNFIHSAHLDRHDLVLCGLSMGGAIVQELLITNPAMFTAGILINTGARLKVHPMVIESVTQNYTQFVQSMPAMSFAPGCGDTGLAQCIIAISGQNSKEAAIDDFNACHHFDVMDKVTSISCPVLVFSAEHDISTPPKFGFWLAQNIPHARHVHVEKAGHLSPMEKPDAINDEIRSFIRNLV